MGQPSKDKNAAKFTRSQLDRIWKAIKEEEWLRLPNSGNLAFRKNRPGDIIGLCPHPDHTDTTPSFHIYPEQRHGYCYGCGYRPTDPVELVSNICEISYAKAIAHIQNICPKVPDIQGAHFRTFVEQQQIAQEIKNIFKDVCHEQLVLATQAYAENLKIQANPRNVITDDDLENCDFTLLGDEPDYPGEPTGAGSIYSDEDDAPDNVVPITGAKGGIGMCDFDYATKTVHWLVAVRKIPLDIIPKLPIGIIPPTSIIPSLFKKVTAARIKESEYAVETLLQYLDMLLSADVNRGVISMGTGAVIFPLCTSESNITSFRIRQPNGPGETKRISLLQDEYDDTVGFFGLNFAPYMEFQRKNSARKPKSYIVVEGEFDALQAMVRTLKTGNIQYPVISAGGNSALASFNDIVIINDIKNLHLMGDSPKKGAADTSTKVVSLWTRSIKDCNISIFSEEAWDKLPGAEDLDHAYTQTNILPEEIEKELGDIQNFIPAWRWVYNQIVPQLLEYTDDNVTALIGVIEVEGRQLLREDDIQALIQAFCERYPLLNPGRLKRGIFAEEDTEEAFVCRIANTITDIYTVIGVTRNSIRGDELCLFRPKTKTNKTAYITNIKLDSEQSIVQEIAKSSGSLFKFLKDVVRLPAAIDPSEIVQSIHPITGNVVIKHVQPQLKYDKACRTYVRNAILDLTKEAHNMDNLKRIRNGYHRISNKEILVNGEDAFTFTREDKTLTFNPLSSPQIDDILIDVYTGDVEHKRAWFKPEPLTVELLQEAQGYDLKKTYENLCRFFDTGFVFEQQKTTCEFLAALALTIPIMACFDRQILVHFTGETSSGKSTLLTVFGKVEQEHNSTDIQLVYTSRAFLRITASAFTRAAANTTLLHCIDELEFDNDKNKAANGSIMESLRGIQGGGGSRTVSDMGSSSGTTTQNYNVPVIFASITGTEKPQDLNRIVRVTMQKKFSKIDPNTAIHQEFSPEELRDLRLATNFGLYSYLPQIIDNYSRIKMSYSEICRKLPFAVESRFLSSFYPLFAIMEAIGIDYIEFMRNYLECNKNQVACDTQHSDADAYLDKIFNNSVIKLQNYKETYQCQSLARALTSRISRHELNDAGVGVFYDETQNLILLNIEQVLIHLVPAQARASAALTALQLRTILSRHTAALKVDEIIASGVLQRAAIHMGVGIKAHHVVALHAAYWFEGNRSAAVTTPTTPATDETKQEETQDEPTNIVSDWCC